MSVAGVLLAAGSSARLGRNKLLVELDGEPLVRRASARALQAGLAPLLVVTGFEPELVRGALAGLDVRFVHHAGWSKGQGGSLAAGAAAVPPEAEAAVVLLADMPLVSADMLAALVARWRTAGSPIACARYGGVAAPPAVFGRAALPELVGCAGDSGAREVIQRHAGAVTWVDLPASALADVDRPADLERVAGWAQAAPEAPGDG